MENGIHSVADLAGYAFWDTDITKMDLKKDKQIIIPRIFERAKLDDVLNTIVFYGIDVCSSILRSNKYLSKQAVYLSHLLLSVPLEKFKAHAPPRNNL
jgi:hypothetical protein